MIQLYKPQLQDLWFRQRLLMDPDTMSYNHRYGGTIDFSYDKWPQWYNRWLQCSEGKRFYRYLLNDENDSFVGEISYHYDDKLGVYLADVIILDQYRGKGYGRQGLILLMHEAEKAGMQSLFDCVGLDNSGIHLFLNLGFEEIYRNDEYIMVKKDLNSFIK